MCGAQDKTSCAAMFTGAGRPGWNKNPAAHQVEFNGPGWGG